MKLRAIVILFSTAVLVGLSFLHPYGDPRVEPRKGFDTLLQGATMPTDAKHVLLNKCADCHSNETRFPVYSRIAPASWLIEKDIMDARKKLNLSDWEKMSPDNQEIMLGKIVHEAKTGAMPPLQYRLLHWKSQLSASDLVALSALSPGGAQQNGAALHGDADRGKMVFEKRCTGCHAMGAGREGPQLSGVFGKPAASVRGFDYSAALKSSKIIWDEATLEKWLADPDAMVPQNKMDFHLPKPQERVDLIAYLKRGL